MILTNEYQFIGRSSAVVSQGNSCSYYLLLYAKSEPDNKTGRHTVSILSRLACNAERSFYAYYTSGNMKIDGATVESWFWKPVPDAPWNEILVQDGITYPLWTDLREAEKIVDCGFGTEKNVQIKADWVFNDLSKESWLPQPEITVFVEDEITLPMIAEASQPTVSAKEIDLGETVTIYTNREADFTHTIRYQFADTAGIIAENVEDFCEWTPEMMLAVKIPNSAAGTAVITCDTYAGDTPVGSKQTFLTLRIPEYVVPTASAVWQDVSNATALMGVTVQNVSRLMVDVTGIGTYGSSIASANVLLDGKPYSGGVITEAGERMLTASVTDSRGRVGVEEYFITVAEYSPPDLKLNASRCKADGTQDETGDHAKVTVTGFVTQINGKNKATLKLTCGGSPEQFSVAVGEVAYQKIIKADPNNTMAMEAVLADKLATATRSMTLSTGYATLDLLKGGKGIAFGKSATREGFECAMPAYFTGGISGAEPAFESPDFPGCYIRTVGGETEWLNPPMVPGVEYRTTERWRGKPVYTKLMDFGTLPNATMKSLPTGIQSLGEVVDIGGTVQSTSAWNGLHSLGQLTDVWVEQGKLSVMTAGDLSGRTALIRLRYTKNPSTSAAILGAAVLGTMQLGA